MLDVDVQEAVVDGLLEVPSCAFVTSARIPS